MSYRYGRCPPQPDGFEPSSMKRVRYYFAARAFPVHIAQVGKRHRGIRSPVDTAIAVVDPGRRIPGLTVRAAWLFTISSLSVRLG
jgi:hypothetical protein